MNDEKTAGLKRHSEEVHKLVKDSLQTALLQLMKTKPYEAITVSELCRRAGVSRMAFYGNYAEKSDIIKQVVSDLYKKMALELGSPFHRTTDKKWYVAFFRFIRDRADLLSLLFDAGLHGEYLAAVNELVLRNPAVPTAKRYQRLLWSGGIENAAAHWLRGGMKESEEEMAEICLSTLIPWSFS